MIFYLCDLNQGCTHQTNCIKYGGDCRHTVNPEHAVNGPCEDDPDKHPERFERATYNGCQDVYYWERPAEKDIEEPHDEEEAIDEDE